MTGKEMLTSLNHIDDDIIEEASGRFTRRKKSIRPWIKWVAVAASLVIIFSGGTVLANSDLGIQIKKIFYMNQYVEVLDFEVEKIPIDELKGDVHEVKDIILQRIKDYSPVFSTLPTYWQNYYDKPEDAIKYLGYESLMYPHWDMEMQSTVLNVYGNYEGNFEHISMDIYYKTEDLYIVARAALFTEHCENPLIYSTKHTDDKNYQKIVYQMDTQTECTIFIREFGSETRKSIEGWVVEDNVIYSVQFGYPIEQEDAAVEIVKEWADSLK